MLLHDDGELWRVYAFPCYLLPIDWVAAGGGIPFCKALASLSNCHNARLTPELRAASRPAGSVTAAVAERAAADAILATSRAATYGRWRPRSRGGEGMPLWLANRQPAASANEAAGRTWALVNALGGTTASSVAHGARGVTSGGAAPATPTPTAPSYTGGRAQNRRNPSVRHTTPMAAPATSSGRDPPRPPPPHFLYGTEAIEHIDVVLQARPIWGAGPVCPRDLAIALADRATLAEVDPEDIIVL